MELTLRRIISDDDTTLGLLYIDDIFNCFIIEDEYREHKVPKETRIPAGKYNIEVKSHGGFYHRYKKRFGDWHIGMLRLCNVPQFTDILIHCGNHDGHTDGCLLVNQGCMVDPGEIRGQASRQAYRALYPHLIGPAERGELTIEIIDEDLW